MPLLSITVLKNNSITVFSCEKQVTFVFISTILTLIFIGLADFYDRYIIQVLPGILFLLLRTYQNKPTIRNNFFKVGFDWFYNNNISLYFI